MSRAATGQQALLNVLPIGQQAHPVAGVECQMGQRNSRCACVVELAAGRSAGVLEFRAGSHPRPHQPAAVEDDPNWLAALALVLAGYGSAVPRRGRPADVAQIVALAVVAQALEVAAQAPLSSPAQLQVELPAAGQKDLLLFAGAQSRIDADRLLKRRPRPAFGEPQRRPIAHIEPAGFPVAALFRFHAVAEAGGDVGKRSQLERFRFFDQSGRQIVHQAAIDYRPAPVFNGQLDLGFAVEGSSIRPAPAGCQLGGSGQAQAIEQREEQHECVPGRHRVGQPPIPEAGNQPNKADQQQADAPWRQSEAPAPPPLTDGADRTGMERWSNHCLGTGTAAITSASTRSASKPSSSASGFNIIRWRSTGLTARFTSSGSR